VLHKIIIKRRKWDCSIAPLVVAQAAVAVGQVACAVEIGRKFTSKVVAVSWTCEPNADGGIVCLDFRLVETAHVTILGGNY